MQAAVVVENYADDYNALATALFINSYTAGRNEHHLIHGAVYIGKKDNEGPVEFVLDEYV